MPDNVLPDAGLPADVLVERAAGHVLLLRLNRPEKRNALSTPVLDAIAKALTAADTDDDVRAVVITGNDAVFAAGADLDELSRSTSADPIESPRFRVWEVIRQCRKPLIAAVEGWCLGGGCELMMRCDIAIAGKDARFGQPETNLGIIPGAGGTALLPRRIGLQKAMFMVLTGQPISAEEALAAGLIAKVCDTGSALAEAMQLATAIAARAPLAIQSAKASLQLSHEIDEPAHLLREREIFLSLMDSHDKAEGIAAFKERRPAQWTGR